MPWVGRSEDLSRESQDKWYLQMRKRSWLQTDSGSIVRRGSSTRNSGEGEEEDLGCG